MHFSITTNKARTAGPLGVNEGVVLFLEMTFPVCLVTGPTIALGYLLGAGLMHLAIGHFMGLPRFVWSWMATYPAIIYASIHLSPVYGVRF